MAPETKIFKITREEEYEDPIYLKLDLHDKDVRTAFLDIYMYLNDKKAFVIRFYTINVIDNHIPKAAYCFIEVTTKSAMNFIENNYKKITGKELDEDRHKRISSAISCILSKVSDIVKRNGELRELDI